MKLVTVTGTILTAMAAIAGQPARAAPDNITVLVVESASPYAPVAGAVVTLRGTDPISVGGLALTTGGGGTVMFGGVTGPYSVTAQTDYSAGGITTRVATSVVDISPAVSGAPPAGTIGVLLEFESAPPPPPSATVMGTIANLPPLVGNEVIEVVAVSRNDGGNVGWASGSSGAYSMAIPSGIVVDCYVAHRTSFGSTPVKASLIVTGVGPVAPSAVQVQNFNFASAVPWSTVVNIAESGRDPNLWFGVQLLVTDPALGVDIDFSIHDGISGPSTIRLPNVVHASLAPFRIVLQADTYDPFDVYPGEQGRSFTLATTPTNVTFDFTPLPTPIQPADGDVMSLSALAVLAVSFTEGVPPAGFGNNGVNGFFLESDENDPCAAPPGIDNAEWTILAAGGDLSFAMPPHTLPMFTTGQELSAGPFEFRVKGYSITYAGFFDANLAAHLAALDTTVTEDCDSELAISVMLGVDTYCSAGISASGCQAMLTVAGAPSASAPSGFVVHATGVEGDKSGVYFFGSNGRQANPWGNGTSSQCVVPPLTRTGVLAPSGTPGNCDGAFSKDMNAYWTANPGQNPGPGVTLQMQLWYRDPANPSNHTTSLSNAIEVCVGQ